MTCHPATLTSRVGGKLFRFIVADDNHVERERPHAELEVLKIYLWSLSP
jgi:hypothetical protein